MLFHKAQKILPSLDATKTTTRFKFWSSRKRDLLHGHERRTSSQELFSRIQNALLRVGIGFSVLSIRFSWVCGTKCSVVRVVCAVYIRAVQCTRSEIFSFAFAQCEIQCA